jgi:glycosyltransferase involved in cell wall biosynthesis
MVKYLAVVIGLLKPFIKPTVIAKVSGAWEFEGGVLDEQLASRPVNKLMNYMIGRIDYLQAISKFTALRLQSVGYPMNKIKMIPNAIDTRKFSNSNTRDNLSNLNVIYTGRLRHVKGIDILIRAWAKVCKKVEGEHPTLFIAGEGSMRPELESMIGELQLENSIKLLGLVSDIPKILDQSHIYVQPSRQEGLSNSVLEAMSAGLPIVATRVSGNEDIVQDGINGILVEPEDPDVLANAILCLLKNKDLRDNMGKSSRDIVQKDYELDIVLQHLTTAYQGGL